ncbi:hypothetical protein [Actinacidiphila sp. ITFR-21]|uniref:hypothetical protein n=1 Tax=Actinacidiphila sp. ITFR-21 TaxID=3075199 RepID=UPI00288B14D1|nr:hypothetical protein [Streptomyces sp. ITFR-21]WNI15254.1 hypothetical protein RLT57_06680 [Streptomyces sp. ITFR-21]
MDTSRRSTVWLATATNGSVIGPDYKQSTVASEASGRRAVTLGGQGQYAEFTPAKAANAVDVAYNLPRGASGTASVYVNGAKIGQKLPVTAQYSYGGPGWTAGSKTHHFFDDSRIQLGQNPAAGAKVKFQLDIGDTGSATIDVADFEQVAAAAAQPANSVSVVTAGADAGGKPTGALRVDSYDYAIDNSIQISNTKLVDSPYGDFEFVSGGGHGYTVGGVTVGGVTVSGATASGTGTVVVQAETPGSASFSHVTAISTGATGVYNCPCPAGLPAFTINKGTGNSGWDGTWGNCGAWPQPGSGSSGGTTGGGTGGTTTPPTTPASGNLAQGRPATPSTRARVTTCRSPSRRFRSATCG